MKNLRILLLTGIMGICANQALAYDVYVNQPMFANNQLATNTVLVSGTETWLNDPLVLVTVSANGQRFTTVANPVDGTWSVLIRSWHFIFDVQLCAPLRNACSQNYHFDFGPR